MGFTVVELLVVFAVLGVLAITVIPALARTGASTQRLYCVDNLKQIGLAFQNWRNAHANVYPMNLRNQSGGPPVGVSTLVSQAQTSALPGAAPYMYAAFGVMSNELRIPKILACPSDERAAHSNFMMHITISTIPQQVQASSSGNGISDFDPAYFNNFKISYFLGVNASDLHPQMFLAGDRNIAGDHNGGNPIPTGNNGYGNSTGTEYWMGTNWPAGSTAPQWSPSKMHQARGNVLLADGSVQQLDSAHLHQELSATGDTTPVPGPNTLLFP